MSAEIFDEAEYHDVVHTKIKSCNASCEHPPEDLGADERMPYTQAYIRQLKFLEEWWFTLR